MGSSGRNVMDLWTVILKRIVTKGAVGKDIKSIIEVISFFANESINRSLLQKLVEKYQKRSVSSKNGFAAMKQKFLSNFSEKNSMEKAFTVLEDCSVIKSNNETSTYISADKDAQLAMHEFLIQENQNGLLNPLETLLSVIDEDLGAFQGFSDQILHVESIWSYSENYRNLVADFKKIPKWIYQEYLRQGKYDKAYDFCCRSLERLKCEDQHPDLLILDYYFLLMKMKGIVLRKIGDYEESLKIFQDAYAEQKKYFTADHSDCWATLHEIGMVYKMQDKFEDALKYFLEVKRHHEKFYGVDHPLTVIEKESIASIYFIKGDFLQSQTIYKELVAINKRKLGASHIETLKAVHSVGCCLYHQGKYDEALKTFSDNLSECESSHQLMITTQYWMALTLKSKGLYKESIVICSDVFEMQKSLLGPEHSQTNSSRQLLQLAKEAMKLDFHLVTIYEELKSGKATPEVLSDAEIIWERIETHKELFLNHKNFPLWIFDSYFRLGRYNDGYIYINQVIQFMEPIFMAENTHENVICFLKMLQRKGKCLLRLGHYQNAFNILLDVHAKQKLLLGEDNDDCLETIHLIGIICWKLEDYKRAVYCFYKILVYFEGKKNSGEDFSLDTLAVGNSVALWFISQNKLQESLEMLQIIQENVETLKTSTSEQLYESLRLSAQHNYAVVQYELGKYTIALGTFQQDVASAKRTIFGNLHPITLRSEIWIAKSLHKLTILQAALELCDFVLEKQLLAFGPHYPETIATENLLKCIKTDIRIQNDACRHNCNRSEASNRFAVLTKFTTKERKRTEKEMDPKRVEARSYTMASENIPRGGLSEIIFHEVQFTRKTEGRDKSLKMLDITPFIGENLKILKISCSALSTAVTVPLNSSIKYLNLENCKVILPKEKLSPKDITLKKTFVTRSQESQDEYTSVSQINLNRFLSFESSQNITICMSGDIEVELELDSFDCCKNLTLDKVTLLNYNESILEKIENVSIKNSTFSKSNENIINEASLNTLITKLRANRVIGSFICGGLKANGRQCTDTEPCNKCATLSRSPKKVFRY